MVILNIDADLANLFVECAALMQTGRGFYVSYTSAAPTIKQSTFLFLSKNRSIF